MMTARKFAALFGCLIALIAYPMRATAQTYGADLVNTVNPASGGMAGVSFARPQDIPSALFGNPATMTQFPGTWFTLGGAFIEPTQTAAHDGIVTGAAFAGKSEAEPGLTVNSAAIQGM